MAVPKYKTSKARTRRRKAINMSLRAPNLIACGQCGNKVLRHRVCPQCGYYRGRECFKPEEMA